MSKQKEESITLENVAKHSGVSYQTVSRVVNNAPNVSDKTRRKVQASINELGYVPNRLAQRLASKKSHTLGLATVDISLHAAAQIAAGTKLEAKNQGFSVVLSIIDGCEAHGCQSAFNELNSQHVDGIIINAPLAPQQAETLSHNSKQTPAIFVDVPPNTQVLNVVYDQHEGASLSAQHLLSLGHQQIAIINGPASSSTSALRLQGATDTLSAQGISPIYVADGDWSAASGYQLTRSLIESGLAFTAMLVANDQMALGVLKALNDQGLRVPHDVSVVGYDDTPESRFYQPALTTVKQDFHQLGKEAVLRLVEKIQGDSQQPQATLLRSDLLIRHSSGPVKQPADMDKLAVIDSLQQVIQKLG
ncbi:LacI family DNA-binding transcriptional regulator [Aliivibrio kagoshimensis]|uniref:LacI family DNA-binding transcriptional regulator n=1 Tax=Aliivibrio kagoshimensis TaxID=2910230 RepID=UPI003D1305E9